MPITAFQRPYNDLSTTFQRSSNDHPTTINWPPTEHLLSPHSVTTRTLHCLHVSHCLHHSVPPPVSTTSNVPPPVRLVSYQYDASLASLVSLICLARAIDGVFGSFFRNRRLFSSHVVCLRSWVFSPFHYDYRAENRLKYWTPQTNHVRGKSEKSPKGSINRPR